MGVASTLVGVFKEMWVDPRRAGAFYAGLTPTIAGIIPYSGTTWSTYETLKERMLRSRGLPPTAELPPHLNAVCGGIAGVMGAHRCPHHILFPSRPLHCCRLHLPVCLS